MKKKLNKQEKVKLAMRRAEELRIAVELEKVRVLEEERRRLEEEKRLAQEKEIRDKFEQGVRLEQLCTSCLKIQQLKDQWLHVENEAYEEAEWREYLNCDGLPDPSQPGQMHTYLHLWDQQREHTSMQQAVQRTHEVLSLLDTLQDFLDNPAVPQRKKQDWLNVRNSFREYQQYNLDCAAYRLLRDIDLNLVRDNIPTASYVQVEQYFTICLWVLIQLPIPIPNPKRPPRPRQTLNFPELQIEVVFPDAVNVWAMCVRAMYVSYEHYSHLCRSYAQPATPERLLLDLLETTRHEWQQKQDARAAVRGLSSSTLAALVTPSQQALQTQTPDQPPPPPAPPKEFIKVDASAIFIHNEDNDYSIMRENLLTVVDPHEVNLRKYTIIGGVFFLDLYYQPPQPIEMVLQDITIATLHVPKWLNEVPFHQEYSPPPPPEPGVTRKPEEIEAELRQQEQDFDRLLWVSLALPSAVLWLDVPVVCQWDADKHHWSTQHVHDVKHNEEKQTVQFRTGKFGPIAMACFKYCSMPYQTWELKPAPEGKVTLTIMAAVLIIEFTVKNNLICVSQLQNAPSRALNHLVGQYHKLPKLKRLLQAGGVDLFPAVDAFCYTESVCEKQQPMERHLYYNMAQCSLLFNFCWSRWNLLAGRRQAIMQMREWSASERVKLPNYSMLMVTPLKALIVDCTEVSPVFNEEGIPKMKFYSDLYHLVCGVASIAVKKKLQEAPMDLVNTVALLLNATRPLSFS